MKYERRSSKILLASLAKNGGLDNFFEEEQKLEEKETFFEKVYKFAAFYIASYGRNSSIHGLSHTSQRYFTSTFLSKILWTFIGISFLGVLAYFLINRLTDYLNMDVNTSISSNYMSSRKFPKVTICNDFAYDDTDVWLMGTKVKDSLSVKMKKEKRENPFLFKLITVEFMASRFWRWKMLKEKKRFSQKATIWHFSNRAMKFAFDGGGYGLPLEVVSELTDTSRDRRSIPSRRKRKGVTTVPPSSGKKIPPTATEYTYTTYCDLYDANITAAISNLCNLDLSEAETADDIDYTLCSFQNSTRKTKCEIYYAAQVLKEHEAEILQPLDSLNKLAGEIVLEAKTEYLYNEIFGNFGPYLQNFLSTFNCTEFGAYLQQTKYNTLGDLWMLGYNNLKVANPLVSEWLAASMILLSWENAFENMASYSDVMIMTQDLNSEAISEEEIDKFNEMQQMMKYGDSFDIYGKPFINITLYSEFSQETIGSNLTSLIQDRSYFLMHPDVRIISSKFGSEHFENATSIFKKVSTPSSYNCFTTTIERRQKVPGHGNGLSLTFFTGTIQMGQASSSLPLNQKSSFKLYIDTDPYSITASDVVVSFSPGEKISVAIDQEIQHREPFPTGTCFKSSTLPPMECIKNCFTLKIKDVCGCVPSYNMSSTDEVECTFAIYAQCQKDLALYKNYTQLALDCNCRLPCDETILTTTATSGQTGITGDLENLQFYSDYDRLLENMRNNKTETFSGPGEYGASGPNFKYLEELIQAYSFKNGIEYHDAQCRKILEEAQIIKKPMLFTNIKVYNCGIQRSLLYYLQWVIETLSLTYLSLVKFKDR